MIILSKDIIEIKEFIFKRISKKQMSIILFIIAMYFIYNAGHLVGTVISHLQNNTKNIRRLSVTNGN